MKMKVEKSSIIYRAKKACLINEVRRRKQ